MLRRALLAVLAGSLMVAGVATALGSPPPSAVAQPVISTAIAPATAARPSLAAGASEAVSAVAAARDAVTDAVAAAAEPTYVLTCDSDSPVRADNPADPNMITNRECPSVTAAKEAANQTYADQVADGECIGYGCSDAQDAEILAGESAAQDEYWARCAATEPGVDGC